MKIPESITNYKEFYIAAKKKGISISSRYVGVRVLKGRSQVYWAAQYNSKHLGSFPFTKEGEIDASNRYKQYALSL
jgi:hypothetical protein